ncbi:flagellar filament capping protein FliD [Halanaerobium kushneri]|jgi:flagellar hook-associated protein 2|uniref:Flagellar hook-associated protein 2 n=1 Tax=Halanaerobium kushneri TaxID=56779 RepID=A0A1N6RMQ7_9FIRM|nr:flagellar filament capping protein FliD [Halanaerobium kushneri]SIQ30081.1 flagellar hook-associated protein 2 [Halanaerobium kushneri]
MSDLSLGGLATGMDTESIINQLVQLEQRPIYNYQQEISELEQTKGAWRDINSRLDNLENKLTDLKLSSTYNSRTASSSNEDVVTATAANSANEANYDITVNQVATAQRLIGARKTSFSAAADDVITLNGTDINISTGDSLGDISSKINDADSGYSTSVINEVLVIEAEKTGVENALLDGSDGSTPTVSDNNGILKELGILDTTNGYFTNEKAATDAKVEINGITGITSSSNEITEAVDSMTFNINPEAAANSTATISVAKDAGKATKAVQAFVDQYNSVMDFMNSKSGYDSETEEGGILQGDGTVMRLQMRLRELVTSKVKDSGAYKTLTSLGIEIDRDGVMSFDSAKFTEALENSPEEVMSIFNAESDSDGYNGMAVRMDSYLNQLMQSNTGLIPRKLDFYDTRIDSLNDDIEDVQRKVEMTRQRYVDQFAAMEEAISEMQSQQSWMMSQLSSMGGSTVSSMM